MDKWWIGLYASSSGGYLWSDDSPLNYLHWNAGEPNDAHGGEKCAEMLSSNCKSKKSINIVLLLKILILAFWK